MTPDASAPSCRDGDASCPAGFDVTRTFVTINATLANGLVEFDFAIGDADMSVELVMPRAAFEEFCRVNRAEILGAAPVVPVDDDDDAAEFSWGPHRATHQRFRHG